MVILPLIYLNAKFIAVVRANIGGDAICQQLEHMLAEEKIEVVPTYKIASKVCLLNFCFSVIFRSLLTKANHHVGSQKII